MRDLGKNQIGFLRAFLGWRGNTERFFPDGTWKWENDSTGLRLAESLEKRGLLVSEPTGHIDDYFGGRRWRLSDAGREYLAQREGARK